MKTITVPRLPDEIYEKYGFDPPKEDNSTYLVPSKQQRIDHIQQTWGSEYDPIEKRIISGGLPLVWERQ